MNSHNITNLATPVNNSDAVTKLYVDTNVGISQTFADGRYYLNTVTLNNIQPNTNNLSLHSYKITNLADATTGTDALNQ